MEDLSYRQDQMYPHEFTKGNGQIGFEPEGDLKKNLGNSLSGLKLTELEGAKFKELSAEDYLVIYQNSLRIAEQKSERHRKKIDAIKKIVMT